MTDKEKKEVEKIARKAKGGRVRKAASKTVRKGAPIVAGIIGGAVGGAAQALAVHLGAEPKTCGYVAAAAGIVTAVATSVVEGDKPTTTTEAIKAFATGVSAGGVFNVTTAYMADQLGDADADATPAAPEPKQLPAAAEPAAPKRQALPEGQPDDVISRARKQANAQPTVYSVRPAA